MKRILLLLLLPFGSYAQEGMIMYDEKVKLQLNIQGDVPEGMVLPNEHTTKKILNYTAESSLYQNFEGGANSEMEQQTEGGVIKIRMDKPDDKSYCDLNEKKVIEQREFMTRKFLVTSDLTGYGWKLTGEQKSILNYPCQQAVRHEGKDGEREIKAWFTPRIPVSSGPGRFAGLPGMVLEVSINNGEVLITASEIKEGKADRSVIQKPAEGKKVTWEEFDKIREEKMKEMEEENGGNGNVIIKMRK